jgi:hypothetical protein
MVLQKSIFDMHFVAYLALYFVFYTDFATASKCQNLQPNQTTFEVDFWPFFPYSVSNTTNSKNKRKGKSELSA